MVSAGDFRNGVTFEEDGRVKAFMKIPMLGKVVMKNIVKID